MDTPINWILTISKVIATQLYLLINPVVSNRIVKLQYDDEAS